MKSKLDIQKFIEENPDWERILTQKPYCLSVSRDNVFGHNLVLLKYNQIETEWDDAGRIARECRGIVLDEDSNEVVSYAFNKFFNSGETYADKLDASSMRSSVKIDGSIIKIVCLGDNVLISTNGTIDAHKAPVADQPGCKFKSFGEIVDDVIVKKFGSLEKFKDILDEGHTYIFELVSPWTRVVSPFSENDMFLIGCRNNKTLEEVFFLDCKLKDHFKTPGILDFSSIDECFRYASNLDWTNEGYVVMDKFFNRVKVKNPAWLAIHHLCSNHVMTYSHAVEVVRTNEYDEVIVYFPEFKPVLDMIREKIESKIIELDGKWSSFKKIDGLDTRKDQAIHIMRIFGKNSGIGFALLDGKISSSRDFMDKCPVKNLVMLLGLKDDV